MTRVLATVAAFVALAATSTAPAAAAPVPWCGTGASAVDRLPDATPGYAIHVVYARGPDAADRFAAIAPRLAGDAAAIETWWRGQDAARSPRFDLFPAPGCASSFGALDITSLQLPQGISSIRDAFASVRTTLDELGFNESEKAYLVYYDGSTGQVGNERVCGQAGGGSVFGPPTAVVYLDSCGNDSGDEVRPIVAVHELMHVFGGVSRAAPHHCSSGHVCDAPDDLMGAELTQAQLSAYRLDIGRDDYYGHAGTWPDVQDVLFLERLDSPDRAAPTTPAGFRIGDDPTGLTRVSWRAAQDDVGPVSYRVYLDGRLVDETARTSALVPGTDDVAQYAVRAADPVGHLSPVATGRFRAGVGMIDEEGRLVLDTVRPPQIARVTVRRTRTTARLTWPAVRDAGGVRAYRVRIGARTVTVRKPAVALARARVTGAVSIAAVDRAGNVGPALVVPRGRVR